MTLGLNFLAGNACRSRTRFDGQPRRRGFGKSVARCRARNLRSASSEEARRLFFLIDLLVADKAKPLSSGILLGLGDAAHSDHGLAESQPGGGGADAAGSTDLRPLLATIVAQDDIGGNFIPRSPEVVGEEVAFDFPEDLASRRGVWL